MLCIHFMYIKSVEIGININFGKNHPYLFYNRKKINSEITIVRLIVINVNSKEIFGNDVKRTGQVYSQNIPKCPSSTNVRYFP